MINKDFVNLVRKMRKAQKQYFADRTQSSLRQACKLEGEVDAQLRESEFVRRSYVQLDLLGDVAGQ